MSDTPRTDALQKSFATVADWFEFARNLERENEFLLKALERLADDLERLAKRLGNGLESVQKKEEQP